MSFAKAIPQAVKEIRLHLCQTSSTSQGVRKFIQSAYPSIKSAHPDLKVLIREAAGIEPKAFVRFERGVESQVPLSGLSEGDVEKALATLVKGQIVGA